MMTPRHSRGNTFRKKSFLPGLYRCKKKHTGGMKVTKTQCKYCENEITHPKEGLCDECWHEYLDRQAAQDEWDYWHGEEE